MTRDTKTILAIFIGICVFLVVAHLMASAHHARVRATDQNPGPAQLTEYEKDLLYNQSELALQHIPPEDRERYLMQACADLSAQMDRDGLAPGETYELDNE